MPDLTHLLTTLTRHNPWILAGEVFTPAPPEPPAGLLPRAALMSFGARSAPTVLNKNKNKNKNKSRFAFANRSAQSAFKLLAHRQIVQLYRAGGAPTFRPWQTIPLDLPPGPDATRTETEALLELQQNVAERARRKPDIELEDTMDVSAFTRPLGIEASAGFVATEALIATVLQVTEFVGLQYKDLFGRTRPSFVEPRLRPMLPVPPHQSFPSNHAFQSHSIALALERVIPQHPAVETLHHVAERIAENREWAGLHYRSDTMAGRQLAERCLPFLVDACSDLMGDVQAEWR